MIALVANRILSLSHAHQFGRYLAIQWVYDWMHIQEISKWFGFVLCGRIKWVKLTHKYIEMHAHIHILNALTLGQQSMHCQSFELCVCMRAHRLIYSHVARVHRRTTNFNGRFVKHLISIIIEYMRFSSLVFLFNLLSFADMYTYVCVCVCARMSESLARSLSVCHLCVCVCVCICFGVFVSEVYCICMWYDTNWIAQTKYMCTYIYIYSRDTDSTDWMWIERKKHTESNQIKKNSFIYFFSFLFPILFPILLTIHLLLHMRIESNRKIDKKKKKGVKSSFIYIFFSSCRAVL